ncbi:MAG: family 10 glycosylhydrolase [Maribacter sp.]|nr:family 10 glycosylhydrolase [Maribacter sp.]
MNKNLALSFFLFVFSFGLYAQFGTIGYDFKDPYVDFDGLKFAVRLSTENNIYCPDLKQLTIEKLSDNEIILRSNSLSAAGGQLISKGSIELKLSKGVDHRISISAQASHPTELSKSILVLVKGIEVQSMVSEQPQAKGVQEFKDKKGIRVSYPSRAATMPLVFLTTPYEEWFVLSKDREIRRKGFACSYDHLSNEPVVLLSHDADMRKISTKIEAPEWVLGKDRPRIEVVKERCIDLEQYFDLIPYSGKPKVHTEWIDNLKVVTFLHGVHWTGHIFNTYDQMGEQLEWITETVNGKQILAFLPAWDGRYYVNYPEHEPDRRMGGSEGLKRLVEKAHRLGVKVVLMFGGPNLSTFEFLKKNNMMEAGLKTPSGQAELQNWLDWNTDLQIETMGLIMNFGHPKYRDYMISKTAELFDTYDIDGVFLDGTLRWQNSPDYSAYEGLVQYTKEIRRRYPEKLVMGEDGYDAIYGLFDLFHTSGGPLGLENYLLRYTRQFYYLAYPAENGSAGVHEIGWSNDSHTINTADPEYTIPSTSLFYGDKEKYGNQIKAKLEAYKNWELKPTPLMKNK